MSPLSPTTLIWITILLIWELVWKAIALWHSARNGQKNWFIGMIILNTAGLLPIIYIYFFQKKHKA